jgi:hypothetical protein
MARSKKKPFIKDKGMSTQDYWTIVRSEWNQVLRSWDQESDLEFRNPKSIINDWSYSDYSWFVQESREYWGDNEPLHWYGWTKKEVKIYSRK